MEIRLASFEPTALVAVSLAGDADEMPRAVRLVDESVAARIEELVESHLDDLVGLDLDAMVAEAAAGVRERS